MIEQAYSSAKSAHKILIEELKLYPEVKTHGFWKAMRSLPDADYVQVLLRDPEYLQDRKFIPDAYAIDVEHREVTIFEVVATHDVPAHKIRNIVNFAWALDEDEYALGLVRCDLSGRRVYDCLAMGIVAAIDRAKEHHDCSKVYQLWQHYTSDICKARLAASASE